MNATITCLPPGETVKEPGLYQMTAAQYHADPCPAPSLSSSIAKLLIDKTPLHAMTAHPRLGHPVAEPTKETDLGSVVHALVLGKGSEYVELHYDDFRSAKAREARDEARAVGKIPILSKTVDAAEKISARIRACLVDSEAPYIFDNSYVPFGFPELVACWQEDGMWFRAMFDWLIPGRYEIDDLKVTGADIGPQSIGRKVSDMGYDVQQAFYIRGLEKLFPETGGRWKFRFVFAEADAPHEAVIVENDATAREMGRRKTTYAIAMWKLCLSRGIWPGYGPKVIVAEHPPFAEAAWLKREESDPSFQGVSL